MNNTRSRHSKQKTIWIDLENSPHIPFFIPIIEELEKLGYNVELTARDCFQVCSMADLHNMKYKRIGRHYGKNLLLKAIGVLLRGFQLLPFAFRTKPDLALAHGSRTQMLAASLLGITSVTIGDYEHTRGGGFSKPTYLITPDLISYSAKQLRGVSHLKYPGIKEDVYVPSHKPDFGIMRLLGLESDNLVVTIRPPATKAHYHNPESEAIYKEVIDYAGEEPKSRIVILPRDDSQEQYVKATWPDWCDQGKIIIPHTAVDGLDLICVSDLVISGGGTVNREAAVLGVPVYSIFRGKTGAVDQFLSDSGKLTFVRSVEDVRSVIDLSIRDKDQRDLSDSPDALGAIVDHISVILRNDQ